MTATVLFAILVILLISVIPIIVGAKLVNAERSDLLWCLVALVVSGVLHGFGLLLPGIGTFVAFLLAGVGFAWVLQTGFIKGLLIHLVQIFFWAVFGAIAAAIFGVAILSFIGLA